MRNLFLNDCKKSQKIPLAIDYDDIENYLENIKSDYTENSNLQEKVFSNLLDDDVTVALNSLQNDFKTVIILCDLEGFSYDEIAEFTGCPVGTVRSRDCTGQEKFSDRNYLNMQNLKVLNQKGNI